MTTVNDRNEYSVSLLPKVTSMSDVVVVGYGRQKKVNLVGAVGTVNFDEKMNTPGCSQCFYCSFRRSSRFVGGVNNWHGWTKWRTAIDSWFGYSK